MTVDLEQPEWNQLMAVLAQAPWAIANPLLMRIGEQLRAQGAQPGRPNGVEPEAEDRPSPETRQRPS